MKREHQCDAGIVDSYGNKWDCSIPLSRDGTHGELAHQSIDKPGWSWSGSGLIVPYEHQAVRCPCCETKLGVLDPSKREAVMEEQRILKKRLMDEQKDSKQAAIMGGPQLRSGLSGFD